MTRPGQARLTETRVREIYAELAAVEARIDARIDVLIALTAGAQVLSEELARACMRTLRALPSSTRPKGTAE